MRRPVLAALLAFAVLLLAPARAPARNAESERLRARAFDLAYNLDRDEAYAALEQALVADPNDPAVYRGMASITWLDILFRRGVVTADDYIGHLKRSDMVSSPPPPEMAARFKANVKKAIELAERQLRARPRSAAAHYNMGAALGVQTTYLTTVEGQMVAGFKNARRAYAEHERVLELDPRRKDAQLIVGGYDYVVARLPGPARWLLHLIAFGNGSKELGLKMIEESAAFPSDVQADSKFLLILLYNREKRWADALRVIADMAQRYPRNRLLRLEEGATEIRAGKAAEAEATLSEGIARLPQDRRPRAFGEEALWRYKRGLARSLLGRNEEAAADLRAAADLQGRDWVHGRTHLELAKLADASGNLERARNEYQEAIRLCDADNDTASADLARDLLNKATAKTMKQVAGNAVVGAALVAALRRER